ncbi:MAG: BTAD domain-containing putative transcriptional regulator [Gaiellaceae bacterium]
MDFRVLGPVEVYDGDRRLPLGGPKQRAVLAVLLLGRNEPVSRDRLIDALWGEEPPTSAPHTLDAYISRLRKSLGPERLTRGSGAYVLHVEPGELDLDRFEALAVQGRELLADGKASDAAAKLREALALWRGDALGDLVYEPFGAHAAAPLHERRLEAVEDRADAELAAGHARDLVGELADLVRTHPFRERLLGQLMLALYRSGQQARALEAFRVGRHTLVQELGLEPGPALRELERAILAHDPSLELQAGSFAPRHSYRRHWPTATIAAVVLAGAAAVGLVGMLRGGASSSVVRLREPATALAHGFGSVWVADAGSGSVARIDESGRAVIDRVPVGGTPGVVVTGGGAVWAASVPGESISRIDPATGTITQRLGLGGGRLAALAFGNGALWVADSTDRSLLEIDPSSGRLRHSLTLAVTPTALVVVGRRVWIADYDAGSVSEVDPRGGSVLATVRTGTGPSSLAARDGSIWVANTLDSTVSRIDASTGTLTSTLAVASNPIAVAASGRSIWVASQYPGSVTRLDAVSGAVASVESLEGSPTAAVAYGRRVWVGTQSLAPHHGGTVTILHTRQITLDPVFQGDLLPPVSDGLTRDELVTYAHVQGSAGTRLVPDLALAVPVPTNGGTVYTFRLRPDIQYSDGQALRAADFRRAIERAFRLGAATREMFTNLIGASACNKTQCDLSHGVVTDDTARTVTFRLVAPDPDLLANLTQPSASPVPRGTPLTRLDATAIPGTGPYVVSEATARHIVWTRNTRFREWSHAAQPDGNPDRIELRFGLQPDQEVREIEAGRADGIVDNIPAAMLPAVRAKYPARLHSYVIPTTDFVRFNASRPPFEDVRVRRAVNLAVDRAEIVRLYGGAALATPTCQVLPPGVFGFRRYCPYKGPDLAEARRLVAVSGTEGQRVVVWGATDDPTISVGVVRYVASVVRSLGYHTTVHLATHRQLAHLSSDVYDRIQMIDAGWGDSAYGFVTRWFECHGGDGWFCSPKVDLLNARARSLQATHPQTAAALWTQIDRELVDQAAWLPMVNERGIDFLSTRVANYQPHPYWGMLVDQLWVRH